MNKETLLKQLHTQLIQFLDNLLLRFPNESNLILARIFIKDQIQISDIMDYIITTLLPLKQLVIDKNEKFFLENNILFEKIKSNTVNHFKNIWIELDTEDKETLFMWFNLFLNLAEKYKKL